MYVYQRVHISKMGMNQNGSPRCQTASAIFVDTARTFGVFLTSLMIFLACVQPNYNWLVVVTILKNISQLELLFPIYGT